MSNKQSSSKRSKKHKPPLIKGGAGGNNSISEEREGNDNVLEELSESSGGKDLSYLSKLHQSTSLVKSFTKDEELITPITVDAKNRDQNSNPNTG